MQKSMELQQPLTKTPFSTTWTSRTLAAQGSLRKVGRWNSACKEDRHRDTTFAGAPLGRQHRGALTSSPSPPRMEEVTCTPGADASLSQKASVTRTTRQAPGSSATGKWNSDSHSFGKRGSSALLTRRAPRSIPIPVRVRKDARRARRWRRMRWVPIQGVNTRPGFSGGRTLVEGGKEGSPVGVMGWDLVHHFQGGAAVEEVPSTSCPRSKVDSREFSWPCKRNSTDSSLSLIPRNVNLNGSSDSG